MYTIEDISLNRKADRMRQGSRIRAYTDVFAAYPRSVQANVQEFGTLI